MQAVDQARELESLRISVARIAQVLGVDNRLRVTDAPYEELMERAKAGRGWNELAALCAERSQELVARAEARP